MTAHPKSCSTDHDAAQHPLEYFDNYRGKFRRDFTLTQLHLVGLVDREQPVAYPLETLPDVVHIPRMPTRELSQFESEALSALAAGQRIHYQWQGDWLRMVGAIRSKVSCQQCHFGPKQQLLGAFSYELVINRQRNYDWMPAEHLLASLR